MIKKIVWKILGNVGKVPRWTGNYWILKMSEIILESCQRHAMKFWLYDTNSNKNVCKFLECIENISKYTNLKTFSEFSIFSNIRESRKYFKMSQNHLGIIATAIILLRINLINISLFVMYAFHKLCFDWYEIVGSEWMNYFCNCRYFSSWCHFVSVFV